MPEPMTEQLLKDIETRQSAGFLLTLGKPYMHSPEAIEVLKQFINSDGPALIAEVRRLRDELRQSWNENSKFSAKQHFLEAVNSELREENERLKRRDDYVTGCMV